MENVVLMANRSVQYGDCSKHRVGGSGIKALVNPQVGLHLLIELRPEVGTSKLEHQHLGASHFFFAERVENAHAVRWSIAPSIADSLGNAVTSGRAWAADPFPASRDPRSSLREYSWPVRNPA